MAKSVARITKKMWQKIDVKWELDESMLKIDDQTRVMVFAEKEVLLVMWRVAVT